MASVPNATVFAVDFVAVAAAPLAAAAGLAVEVVVVAAVGVVAGATGVAETTFTSVVVPAG